MAISAVPSISRLAMLPGRLEADERDADMKCSRQEYRTARAGGRRYYVTQSIADRPAGCNARRIRVIRW
jgi:hypothetical protein